MLSSLGRDQAHHFAEPGHSYQSKLFAKVYKQMCCYWHFKNTISVSSSLDPDQAQHSVEPDHGDQSKLFAKVYKQMCGDWHVESLHWLR